RVLGFLADFYDPDAALRVAIAENSSPFAPQYELMIVEAADRDADDTVLDEGDFSVVIDPRSAPWVDGTVIDFVGAGFEITNPTREHSVPVPAGELAVRVQRAIDERTNPGVASHGGQIELVDVSDT